MQSAYQFALVSGTQKRNDDEVSCSLELRETFLHLNKAVEQIGWWFRLSFCLMALALQGLAVHRCCVPWNCGQESCVSAPLSGWFPPNCHEPKTTGIEVWPQHYYCSQVPCTEADNNIQRPWRLFSGRVVDGSGLHYRNLNTGHSKCLVIWCRRLCCWISHEVFVFDLL